MLPYTRAALAGQQTDLAEAQEHCHDRQDSPADSASRTLSNRPKALHDDQTMLRIRGTTSVSFLYSKSADRQISDLAVQVAQRQPGRQVPLLKAAAVLQHLRPRRQWCAAREDARHPLRLVRMRQCMSLATTTTLAPAPCRCWRQHSLICAQIHPQDKGCQSTITCVL